MKKLELFMCACIFMGAANATVWNPAGNGITPPATGDWGVAANWTGGSVPLGTDPVVFNVDNAAECVVDAPGATCSVLKMGDNGTTNGNFLRIGNGGELITEASDWSAVGYNRSATLIVEEGGYLQTGGRLGVGWFGSGASYLTVGGEVVVNGTLQVGTENGEVSYPDHDGIVQLVGSGSIVVDGGLDFDSGSGSTIDVEQGSLVFAGDLRAQIAPLITSGEITAYGGSGTVLYDYNATNSGKTTVWADITEKSYNPSPPDGAIGVSIDADLGWTAGAYAASHDVYFGTNPTPGPAEFMGNRTETTFSLSQLEPGTKYYWRIDDVDTGNPESPWTGDVWSFTTASEGQGALLGAFYYPWYDTSTFNSSLPLGNQTLVYHLNPQVLPALGWYNQRNPGVLNQHFQWAQYAGIDFFACSYWGIGSRTDDVIRNYMFDNPDRGDIQLCVFMEPSITPKGGATEAEIIAETEHLCDYYFNEPGYFRVDDKPVIFIYLTRAMSDADLTMCLNAIRTTAATKGIGDVYIVGDEVWGVPNVPAKTPRVNQMDGVTNYDVYGNMGRKSYVTDSNLNTWQSWNASWKSLTDSLGKTFVPGISPGYNDRGQRPESDNPACSRKLNNESSEFGSLFSGMIDRLDPGVEMVIVNSWNEWHEDTQIEPTTVAGPVNIDDGVDFGYYEGFYTQSVYYEGYGMRYLDILRNTIGTVCGDGICSSGENPCNCSADCGMPSIADFVCDLKVDLKDLMYMASVWLTDDTTADIALPADGTVSLPDFSVLSSEWSP